MYFLGYPGSGESCESLIQRWVHYKMQHFFFSFRMAVYPGLQDGPQLSASCHLDLGVLLTSQQQDGESFLKDFLPQWLTETLQFCLPLPSSNF